MKQHPDTYDKFVDWYQNNFTRRNGGFVPQHLKRWYNTVVDAHKDLIAKFGGFRLQREYGLKEHQNLVSSDQANDVIRQIKEIVPHYLANYGYSDEVFLCPVISNGTHNFIKTGKHILSYTRQYLRDASNYSSQYYKMEKLVSQLGEFWSRFRTSETKLEVTISCSPQAFVLLGHYGPDHDSCFRQGSTSQRDKYSLAQTKNTFVITLGKKHPKKDKNINVGRFLGWFNIEDNVYNICNYYCTDKIKDGDTTESVRLLMTELLGAEPAISEDVLHIDKGVHFNRNGLNLTFGKTALNPSSNLQILRPNCQGISIFSCPKCGIRCDTDRYWQNIDDMFVCPSCYDRSLACQVSGRRTFQPLVEYISRYGDTFNIHPEVAKQYQKCEDCGIYYDELEDVNGVKACKDCIENKFTYCDVCDRPVADSEIVDIADLAVCSKCLNEEATRADLIAEIDELKGELECFQKTS